MARKYKDRHNDKRRVVYWLEHHGLGWIAAIVRRTKVIKEK